MDTPREKPRILLTGSTGYVGGRLAPRLLQMGHPVRCLVRDARKLQGRAWAEHPRVEIVQGQIGDDPHALAPLLAGCGPAFYLVHAMGSAGAEFVARDAHLARVFAQSAGTAGLERVIYLGGLGELGDDLSPHLASRREVESELRTGPTPVTVFRAAMVIGSGSASFEILNYLVERLPVMVCPRWVATESQPIAIRDVLHYLTTCLDTPATIGRTIDIGGSSIETYRGLMRLAARSRGLPRRLVITLPVLTPGLASHWIGLVTPVPARIARPLAEGLRNRVVCRNGLAHELMPHETLSAREAIDLALLRRSEDAVETSWTTAGVLPGDPDWAGGTVLRDERSIEVQAPPDAVFEAITRVGGGHGYYAADALWRLRGWMDTLAGGPGLRRGRRSSRELLVGEALDFWRVVDVRANTLLRLRAEMRLPGEAMLEFKITAGPGQRHCSLTQTALFRPKGLLGLAYWYAVLPLHHVVFSGMLGGIQREAERIAGKAPRG